MLLLVPRGRWLNMSNDLLIGLIPIAEKHDTILGIVDRLPKYARFISTITGLDALGYLNSFFGYDFAYHAFFKKITSHIRFSTLSYQKNY